MINRLSSTVLKGSSFMNYNFMFYKAINCFASQSFESLLTQISSSTSANGVVLLYSQHKDLYKSEHVVLSLRTVGRLSKSLNPEQQQAEEFKNVYEDLTRRVDTMIDEINEFDLLDVLFWLRRTKQTKLPSNLQSDTYNALFRRIGEFVQQRVYSFRNLVNIYYDMSMVGRYGDFAPDQLLKAIRADSSQLTQFAAVQILQAAAKRSSQLSFKESLLLDAVMRHIQPILEDFDYDQKATLFKYISQLELHYQFPQFKVPQALYSLRQSLIEKLDKLTELPVINILLAYQSLPVYFPHDLFEEITEMVVVTLQHNAENLKTQFLLDFTEHSTNIPRRRLDEKKLSVITKELVKRLLAEPEQTQVSLAERIAKLYTRLPRDPVLVEAMVTVSRTAIERGTYLPLISLELLSNSHEYSIELIKNIPVESAVKLNNNQKMRLLGCAVRIQDSVPELVTALKKSLEEQVEKNPSGLVLSQENLHLSNSYLRQLNLMAIKQLKENLTSENFFRHFKTMFLSIDTFEARQEWNQYLDAQVFSSKTINKFIEDFDFYNKHSYTSENINFFLTVVSTRSSFVHGGRLVQLIHSQPKLCQEIARNDGFIKRLVQLLVTVKEGKGVGDLRLTDVLQLVLRLEQAGVRSSQFRYLLKKCYDLQKQQQDGKFPQDHTYIAYMIKYKCLPEDYALQISQNFKSQDPYFKVRVLGLAQQAPGGMEQVQEQLTPLVAELVDRLKSDKLARQLISVPALLNLHPSSWSGSEEQMLRILQENASKVSDKVYQQILMAVQPKWYKSRDLRKSYQPIVKELINQHSQKRMNFADNILVMEQYNLLRIKNTQLFNTFLTECGNHFDSITNEQRVRTLMIFANAGVRQQDFFLKNLEKIRDSGKIYFNFIQEISVALFRVGIDDAVILETYTQFITKQGNYGNIDRLYVIQTLCMMGAPTELISTVLSSFNFTGVLNFPPRNIILVTQYLERIGLREGSDKIKAVMDPSRLQEAQQQLKTASSSRGGAANDIGQYLQAMRLKFETSTEVDGLFIDIYVPEQKTLIVIVYPDQMNFNQHAYGGNVQLQLKSLELVKDHKLIVIPIKEFTQSGPNHVEKVNYLLSKGIISNNSTGQYEFAHIKVKKQQKGDEIEQEQEAEVDDELENKQSK